MKIVEIIPHLTSGGAERFTVDLCNELAKRHEVWLILFFPLEDKDLHFLLPEVCEKVKVMSLDKRKGMDLTLPFRLKRILKTVLPDVVHCHGRAFPYTFIAALMRPCHSRWYYTVHSDARFDAGKWPLDRMRKFAFRQGLFNAVTISEESLRSFRNYYGIDAPMIVNGRALPSHLSPFTPHPSTTLVSLARFSAVKRQDMLARIARRLHDEGYIFTLQLIGQHQDAEILSAVREVDCKCIEIVGEVSTPLEYLRKADAFCLCSTHEGMPISLIEAMSIGVVPVCTPVGGIVNIVEDGVSGFLSKDISEESYYEALKRFLDTPKEKTATMSRCAMQAALPYNMEKCAKKYEQLWNAIMV